MDAVLSPGTHGPVADARRVQLNIGTIDTQLSWTHYDGQLENMDNLVDSADMEVVVRT